MTQTELENDPLLSVQEVAERLRVESTTVLRWIKNGALEAVELPLNPVRRQSSRILMPRQTRQTRQSYRIRERVLTVLLQGTSAQSDS